MIKCKHLNIEVHDYRPEVSGIGIRCVDCHAVMETNAAGKIWRSRHTRYEPLPVERKYWKEFKMPPPPSRLDGYKNCYMVRK